MSPISYPILFFIAGIVTYSYYPDVSHWWFGACWLVSLIFHKLKWHLAFFISIALLSSVAGVFTAQLHDPLEKECHYYHQEFNSNEFVWLRFKINEVRKPNPIGQSFIVSVINFNSTPVCGKALLQVSTDDNRSFKLGTVYRSVVEIKPIEKPKNPGSFDFSNYMQKQEVFFQIRPLSPNLNAIENDLNIKQIAYTLRSELIESLHLLSLKPDNESILRAMVLGDRSEISEELMNNFSAAGAVHLLAISGLHVGVLMLLIHWVLSPLLFLPKGKNIRLLMIVCSLWGFALLTGLSPSVVRAVCMFSFVSVGIASQRPTVRFQSVWLSLLLLLIIQPSFVYDVGFQLSYAAVFGILWIHPLVMKKLRSKKWLLNKMISLFILGCIAQLSVLPFTLYYFHQFPVLFFVSNLLIIPVLGLILGGGILGVFFSHLGGNVSLLGHSLDLLLSGVNFLVKELAQKEQFILSNIPFDVYDTWVGILVVIGLFMCIEKLNSFRVFILIFSSLLFHFSIRFYGFSTNQFIVFHQYKKTILGVSKERVLELYSDDHLSGNSAIVNYQMHAQLTKKKHLPLPNLIKINNNYVLVIDQNGVYDIPFLHPAIILLKDSPKIHLDHVIASLNPQIIIADGSNYPSFKYRWRATCLNLEVDFHSTHEKGAYVLDLKR